MDEKLLKHVATYYPIYQYVGSCTRSLEEIRDYLISEKVHRNTAKSQVESIAKDNPGLFRVNGDLVTIDKEKAVSFIGELDSCFASVMDGDATVANMVSELQRKKEKLQADYKALEAKYEALKKKKERATGVSKKKLEACKIIFPKVLELDSVSVGEIENMEDRIFIKQEPPIINYEDYVRKHGFEKDSFYMELPENHEMSEQNYKKKTFANIFLENRFIKRLQETKQIKEKSKDLSLREEIAKTLQIPKEAAALEERFLRGRAISVQEILSDDKLSNQEKLALYAFHSPYRKTDMERLLNLAGDECVNANWLIMLLETPDLCSNYENVENLLRQCLKPSEWAMKQRLAEELIDGQWYIKAKYQGKETRFQLVPIDEFNEIREKLELDPSAYSYHPVEADKAEEKVQTKTARAKKTVVEKVIEPEITKPADIPTAPEKADEGLPDEIANYGEEKE